MARALGWALVGGALELCGCVTTAAAAHPTHDDDFTLALPPASLGRSLHLAQRLTMTRGDERHTFDAQLEAEPDEVRVAAFALGQTVAQLSWDGRSLTERHSQFVPAAVTPARILSDLQLAWWPPEAIRAGLPAGFTLTDEAGLRRVLHAGRAVAEVRFEGAGPVYAHVALRQLAYGYQLDVESKELP